VTNQDIENLSLNLSEFLEKKDDEYFLGKSTVEWQAEDAKMGFLADLSKSDLQELDAHLTSLSGSNFYRLKWEILKTALTALVEGKPESTDEPVDEEAEVDVPEAGGFGRLRETSYIPTIIEKLSEQKNESPVMKKIGEFYSYLRDNLVRGWTKFRDLLKTGFSPIVDSFDRKRDESRIFDVLIRATATLLVVSITVLVLTISVLRFLSNPLERIIRTIARLFGIRTPAEGPLE